MLNSAYRSFDSLKEHKVGLTPRSPPLVITTVQFTSSCDRPGSLRTRRQISLPLVSDILILATDDGPGRSQMHENAAHRSGCTTERDQIHPQLRRLLNRQDGETPDPERIRTGITRRVPKTDGETERRSTKTPSKLDISLDGLNKRVSRVPPPKRLRSSALHHTFAGLSRYYLCGEMPFEC